MVQHSAAARLPLLERLGRDGHGRALDRDGLRDSVGRELLRLLNTRSGPRPTGALSVIDYGVPDWSSCYTADFEDRQRLARVIEAAVRAFEPRLRAPRAEVLADPGGMRRLRVLLHGALWDDGAGSAITYGLALDGAGAAPLGPAEGA